MRERLSAALKQAGRNGRSRAKRTRNGRGGRASCAKNGGSCGASGNSEIDASIARRADTEYLYDQPYEDSKRIRVSGPFTVESLSPHRVLAPEDEERPATEREESAADAGGDFVTVILDNLPKTGIKGTDKGQAIRFERLEAFAGGAASRRGRIYGGRQAAARGVSHRAAVRHGGSGRYQGSGQGGGAAAWGLTCWWSCGFAFDPHVSEEVKRYGKLAVQVVRMNPDLLMGEELLKKTGAGNLFMVFGEPDVEIRQAKDGQLEVEVRGRGRVRPHHAGDPQPFTEDIACWFIDTDYNGESFFVRYAYFTGPDEPYEKLKRALRAEVDEAAWASLYSTTSRPFARPKSEKIAVKVINHYGDEVLKVFGVG